MHVPADAPPQPLGYRPAAHDEAAHTVQTEAPELETSKDHVPVREPGKDSKRIWYTQRLRSRADLEFVLTYKCTRVVARMRVQLHQCKAALA